MNLLLIALLSAAFALITLLVGGGPAPVYSFPSYSLIALAGLISVFPRKRVTAPPGAWCLAATLWFAAYVAARAVLSPVPYLALNDLFLVLAATIVYLLFSLYLTAPRHRLAFVVVVMILAVVQVGIGLVQYAEKENFMLLSFLPRPDYGARASGFFGCPNHLAGFLEITVVFALSIAFWSEWPGWARALSGYVALACLIGQLLTGSRGGYLSLVAGVAVFVTLSLGVVRKAMRPRFWRLTGFTLLLGAVLAGGVIFLISHSELIRNRAGTVADTHNMRLILWSVAQQQFELAPVIGTGAGTFLFYGRLFRPGSLGEDPRFVHNDYLHLLAEYGIIGAGLCLFFVLLHVIGAIRRLGRVVEQAHVLSGHPASNRLALVIGSLSAVAALAVHSALDFNLHIPANALLMAFVFACLARSNPEIEGRRTGARDVFNTARFILPVLGLWIIAAAVPMVPGEYYAEKARFALARKEYWRAIRYAQKGIVRQKNSPDLFYYLGWSRALFAREQPSPIVATAIWNSAAESLRDGLDLFPQDRRLWIALGHTLAWLHRYEEAYAAMDEAVRWDPNSASLHEGYGKILKDGGRLEAAREQFKKALSMRPSASAQSALNEIEAALKERERVLEER